MYVNLSAGMSFAGSSDRSVSIRVLNRLLWDSAAGVSLGNILTKFDDLSMKHKAGIGPTVNLAQQLSSRIHDPPSSETDFEIDLNPPITHSCSQYSTLPNIGLTVTLTQQPSSRIHYPPSRNISLKIA